MSHHHFYAYLVLFRTLSYFFEHPTPALTFIYWCLSALPAPRGNIAIKGELSPTVILHWRKQTDVNWGSGIRPFFSACSLFGRFGPTHSIIPFKRTSQTRTKIHTQKSHHRLLLLLLCIKRLGEKKSVYSMEPICQYYSLPAMKVPPEEDRQVQNTTQAQRQKAPSQHMAHNRRQLLSEPLLALPGWVDAIWVRLMMRPSQVVWQQCKQSRDGLVV